MSQQWQDLIGAYRSDTARTRDLKIASLAQWILESGRGTSDLAKLHQNFGGLKFRERMRDHAGYVDYRGTDGDHVLYCKFNDANHFIRGYWHFIASGPYDGWQNYSSDAAGYILHIAPGYAADPEYKRKVLSLFEEADRLLNAGVPADAATPATATTTDTAKVAIVVGHNSVSKGANSILPLSKREFDFNSTVAAAMAQEAGHYNLQAKVFFRQASNYAAEIANVYAEVAAWSPACAIELHFNSVENPQANGSEVIFRNDSASARSFSAAVFAGMHRTLGLTVRHGNGLKPISYEERGGASVFALAHTPTVLVEPFFGSNREDVLRVASLGEAGLALAYLRGIRDWTSRNVASPLVVAGAQNALEN